jgi:hypothetical protein
MNARSSKSDKLHLHPSWDMAFGPIWRRTCRPGQDPFRQRGTGATCVTLTTVVCPGEGAPARAVGERGSDRSPHRGMARVTQRYGPRDIADHCARWPAPAGPGSLAVACAVTRTCSAARPRIQPLLQPGISQVTTITSDPMNMPFPIGPTARLLRRYQVRQPSRNANYALVCDLLCAGGSVNREIHNESCTA